MQGKISRLLNAVLSIEPRKGRFFRPIDWTGFWAATLVAFAVYFFTLGPSVGLEDSGELAVAGDHLGVPHPPGYPFWTLCSWIFCRIFSFVTYQGQPTPAWAISCLSAVFGALAAGCAAMLITRSASDWLDGLEGGGSKEENAKMSLAAGLGGALVFAFSPVEWSQSTIVEIYSLNALFLMAVFLFSYRWMRRQNDKVLWLTAFVFGLGLTNYQVLLFAIVPLAIIIFLRNIRLFRDALALAVPLALTLLTLSMASLDRASSQMDANVIPKHLPPGPITVTTTTITESFLRGMKVNTVTNDTSKTSREDLEKLASDALLYDDKGLARRGQRTRVFQSVTNRAIADSTPSSTLLWIAFILIACAPVAGLIAAKNPGKIPFSRHLGAKPSNFVLAAGGLGVVVALAGTFVFTSPVSWVKEWEAPLAPLVSPVVYATIGILLGASAFIAAAASFEAKDDVRSVFSGRAGRFTAAAAVAGALAFAIACFQPDAGTAGYAGKLANVAPYCIIQVFGVALLFLLTAWSGKGILFAIPVAAVQLTAMMLVVRGAMNGLTHPASWWFFWPVIWNFIALALAYATLPNGKSIAPAFFFGELGVSFYAYMPIVSDLRNPPMNWGYPRTWDGFKHALTRGQYEAISFVDTFLKLFTEDGIKKFAEQVGNYCQDLRLQFTLVAATLALLPFTLWRATVRMAGKIFRIDAFKIAAAIYVATAMAVIVFSELLDVTGDGEVPFRLDKWAIAVLGLMALIGLAAILKDVVLATLAAAGIYRKSAENESANSWTWPVTLKFGSDAVLKEWLVSSGVCFAVMSFILIALAKPKGDVQDGFIQKVKFISSHGIFSLWIGYGLALGLSFAWSICKRVLAVWPGMKKAAFLLLCLAAAMVAAIPVYENYTNERLVFEMGGAEQNGHTFGWQFGNWQLRGAAAIREELSADEEPLPNPLYPPEMEKNAIFFGGTDPGRFVPTYMIYSALVRPDVYLITQNALADETYMSVERDLYGDEIWIPSRQDASDAFGIYVDEVKSGKREKNPGLSFINGKVQVVGAEGVMEINGIITEMMFKKERLRRAFYVEESYAIPWMYPYLQPHGLIMRIAPEAGEIPGRLARNDMDFWDWYRRRLLRDKAFRRDFPAQKAFSKLRAAIAGLYMKQGSAGLGAQAFREAYMLYPASPEAAFRYLREVLLPRGMWYQILDILDYTDRVDPNNERTKGVRRVLDNVLETDAKIARLLEKERNAPLPATDVYELACLYAENGLLGKSRARIKDLLAIPGVEKSWAMLYRIAELQGKVSGGIAAGETAVKAVKAMPANAPAPNRVAIALLLHQCARDNEALEQIVKAIDKVPRDVHAWLLKARILTALGLHEDALEALTAAKTIDRAKAARLIAADPLLTNLDKIQ